MIDKYRLGLGLSILQGFWVLQHNYRRRRVKIRVPFTNLFILSYDSTHTCICSITRPQITSYVTFHVTISPCTVLLVYGLINLTTGIAKFLNDILSDVSDSRYHNSALRDWFSVYFRDFPFKSGMRSAHNKHL